MSDADDPAILTKYATQAAREVAERVEREVIGAWRSGYDFVFVVTDRDNPRRMLFHPTNHPEFPSTPSLRVERYDLRDVSAEDVQAIRNGEL